MTTALFESLLLQKIFYLFEKYDEEGYPIEEEGYSKEEDLDEPDDDDPDDDFNNEAEWE